MLNRRQKEEVVKDLKDKISRKEIVLFVSLAGVDVKTVAELRRKLREARSDFQVAKKTLLALALKEEGVEVPLKDIPGPFGVVFDYESQTQAIKTVAEFAARSNVAMMRALWRENIFEEDKVKELSLLPDIDVLRARLILLLGMPFRSLLMLLSHNQKNLLRILNQLIKQKESPSTSP